MFEVPPTRYRDSLKWLLHGAGRHSELVTICDETPQTPAHHATRRRREVVEQFVLKQSIQPSWSSIRVFTNFITLS